MDACVEIPVRTCKGCGQDLPATLDVFPRHPQGKHGLYTHCRPCKKTQDAERRARPEQKARQQAWRDANKARVRQYNAAYREAGYRSTADVARWRAENIDEARKLARERISEYRRTKPWFMLKDKVSARMRQMLLGCGGKAKRHVEALLGYTLDDLVAHMEKQFTKGMNWESFHRGEIHIDHIRPVAEFKPESADCPEFKACWALTNLRPIWAQDNRAKGAKRLYLL